jgi:hypothetical protein
MRDNMTIEDVDPELTMESICLIGIDCYEKSNNEKLSYQDRLKYYMAAMKAKEFLESMVSLSN